MICFFQYGFDFHKIEKQLKENNIELMLRMHPVNVPPESLIELIKSSPLIHLDSGKDIYESIANYDCLVTDYSSIYFDFLLSDKPIIFAPFDLKHYQSKERSLYFEFNDVTLTPYCLNWDDVIKRIIAVKNKESSDEYMIQYKQLKKRFHSTLLEESLPFSNELFEQVIKL